MQSRGGRAGRTFIKAVIDAVKESSRVEMPARQGLATMPTKTGQTRCRPPARTEPMPSLCKPPKTSIAGSGCIPSPGDRQPSCAWCYLIRRQQTNRMVPVLRSSRRHQRWWCREASSRPLACWRRGWRYRDMWMCRVLGRCDGTPCEVPTVSSPDG